MENQERWQMRQQERWQRRQERWERRRQRWEHRSATPRIAGALVIIAVGTAFLLDNLGIVHFRELVQYWPAILIAFGVVRLVDAHGTASMIWGGTLTVVGALLLLDNLNIIYFDWRVFWPLILIGWGALMLIRPFHRRAHWPQAMPAGGMPGPAVVSNDDTLNLWAAFGGGKRRIDSQAFRGGEVSAIFAGFEVDLRGAAMAEQEAIIDVNATFGGVEIKVPETWTIEMRGVGIFGGFGDSTVPPRADQVTRPQRLIITGYAVFGGCEIKN